jgi:hypothetical protein
MSCTAAKVGGAQVSSAKSQICKFADLKNLLDLRAFRKCGTFLRICSLRTNFSDFWTLDLWNLDEIEK